jgi:hypothetical protein
MNKVFGLYLTFTLCWLALGLVVGLVWDNAPVYIAFVCVFCAGSQWGKATLNTRWGRRAV